MQLENIYPIILAGGRGKRLRPMTSYRKPKPFVTLRSNYNLLQETLIRASGLAPPTIVCQQMYIPKVEFSLRSLARYDIFPRAIVAEPYVRSTAPAIGAACLSLAPYMTFVVLPSDHIMDNEGALMKAISEAGDIVNEHGGFVSIGVKPRGASRRFGYLHKGARVDDTQIYHSEHFMEKPSSEYAGQFVKSGEYLWNTGIFVGRVLDYLSAFQAIEREYLYFLRKSFENSRNFEIYYELKRDYYHKIPAMSVDRAILEQCTQRYAVEHDGYWDDAGTWPSYLKLYLMRLLGIIKR